ncbi:MAG: hypothetical protein IJL89_09990 [Firmicutes bacterium]|nr:hypothetical protein [Bacillota bacterium]
MSFLTKFKAMIEGTRFLILCEDVRKYAEKNYDPDETLGVVSAKEQKKLEPVFFASYDELIAKKGLTDDEIRQKSNINKTVLTKLRAHSLVPSKRTLIQLAIAMELDINDAEWLLQSAGYEFSRASMGDLAARFFIECKLYDMKLINDVIDSLGYKIKG